MQATSEGEELSVIQGVERSLQTRNTAVPPEVEGNSRLVLSHDKRMTYLDEHITLCVSPLGSLSRINSVVTSERTGLLVS